jgi:hypothetical protein
MKKIILSVFSIFALGSLMAQSMNENFDSRTVGDYMGVVSPDWTTWSGAVGGAEDVQVTNVMAASGANSIYFSTTSPIGGPQDVLVPFGGVHNTGNFVFESNFYIEDNRGAYFNFQGETTPGALYTLNCQMVNDGRLLLDAGAAPLIETTFPSATWFNLKIQVNLNTNDWELLIDDVSQGVFANPNNQLASADLYPVNAAAGGNNLANYYMDDVVYEYTPYVLPSRNGAVTNIYNTGGLATTSMTPSVTVRNLGTNAITSFDLDVTYNGTTYTENITGVSIASLATYDVDFSDMITLIAGFNVVTATISNVNGIASDDDNADDMKSIGLNPVVPAAGKVVVGEEATGTWCKWCPRGAVYLEKMSVLYPDHFIGIAVHNGDPMTVDTYDEAIGGFISGYPSMLVDRGADIDPSAVEGDFLDRVVIAPKAVLTVGSDYVGGATSMNVSVTADFLEAISGDYRLALVVIEDSVTGTGSGYNQSNAYAGGGAGEMGGYESLPNPVPASMMVYDHVARMILPNFNGMAGSFPASVASGESHVVSFVVNIDPTWDLNEVHLVGMLIAPDSQIDNAGFVSMDEAAANGYVGLEDQMSVVTTTNLYPNPTHENTNIDLGDLNNENVIVEIYDINGKLVLSRNYGLLNGHLIIPMDLVNLENGVYLVHVLKGHSTEIKKLVIE